MSVLKTSVMLLSLLVFACAGEAPKSEDEADAVPEMGDFFVKPTAGKADTAYLSTLATEVEGIYASRLSLSLDGMTPGEREELAAQFRIESMALRQLIDEQLKFAKKQLNAARLRINLSAGDEVEATTVEITEKALSIEFSVRLESIITAKDLEAEGITLEDLENTSVDVVVPLDPRAMRQRAGENCASGHSADLLDDHNYFYYYEPEKRTCTEPTHVARFTVRSRLPAKTVYPEYDLLAEDGRLDVAIYFGIASSNYQPGFFDWGQMGHDEVFYTLVENGFEDGGYAEPVGRYLEKHENGLHTRIHFIGPLDLGRLSSDEKQAAFRTMVSNNEVVMYNGHSFYGSLAVLNAPEHFPQNRYQIFFMNSCWSYEYYTKQIFASKSSPTDPRGWALADVVNNTEVGQAHNGGGFSAILLANIKAGTEFGGIQTNEGRYFTWANIIGAMNEHAIDAMVTEGKFEIYGVSGVRQNRFSPDGSDPQQAVRP